LKIHRHAFKFKPFYQSLSENTASFSIPASSTEISELTYMTKWKFYSHLLPTVVRIFSKTSAPSLAWRITKTHYTPNLSAHLAIWSTTGSAPRLTVGLTSIRAGKCASCGTFCCTTYSTSIRASILTIRCTTCGTCSLTINSTICLTKSFTFSFATRCTSCSAS